MNQIAHKPGLSRRQWVALRAWAATGESPGADQEVKILKSAVAEVIRLRRLAGWRELVREVCD